MSIDLSERHAPVSDLFPDVGPGLDLSQYRLTPEQIAFFDDNGYVAGIKVLDDRQVEALRGELADWSAADHPGRELWYEYNSNESSDPGAVLFHALGAWRIGPGFHDLPWNPAIAVPAAQLLGGAVRFWHDQLFCKPARHGGVVAWHQDYSYWTRTTPMQHLTCWIALDDSDRGNGCLQYVPGSHRWDLLPITGLAGDMHAIRQVLDDDQWRRLNEPVAIEIPKGYATFHHPLMVHGSFGNATDRPRRAAVVNLFKDGTASASDQELLRGVPPVPAGSPMGGRFFPLVFDPSAG